tara:strand:+ start:1024 stop:1362 length:339 start_codon:yes stop_codon:yes gene_type:complete
MAKKEVKHSVVEALNTETSAQFDQQAAVTASTSTVNTLIGKDYSHVYIQSNNDIYFSWNTSTSDNINASNSLFLLGGSDIYILRVPQGIGDSVYFQLQRKGGTDSTVRMIVA